MDYKTPEAMLYQEKQSVTGQCEWARKIINLRELS